MVKQDPGRISGLVYVAYSTLNTALDMLKEGVPPTIDRSVFQGQSGSTQAQVMSAFKALNVINSESEPVQPLLSRLVDESTRKATLKGILEDKYGDIIALHRANATEQTLNKRFADYGVSSPTMRKAKAFFLRAAEDVGIYLSPHVAKKIRQATSKVATKRPRKKQVTSKGEAVPAMERPSGDNLTVSLGGGTVTLGVAVKLTEMSTLEWEWLRDLIDRFRNYNN
ncbi:MAG: DUF5343 domain-containing protein [Candidatus Eremiobacteraeota bacterium]|nr:DUF5343 domain-containing protein [Candidatus Eremiobacteraeota bacterium]MBC5826996.1 DUF5343 domain-containing protein [Candidatus Eremiobacteraeota bacterium]